MIPVQRLKQIMLRSCEDAEKYFASIIQLDNQHTLGGEDVSLLYQNIHRFHDIFTGYLNLLDVRKEEKDVAEIMRKMFEIVAKLSFVSINKSRITECQDIVQKLKDLAKLLKS